MKLALTKINKKKLTKENKYKLKYILNIAKKISKVPMCIYDLKKQFASAIYQVGGQYDENVRKALKEFEVID